MTDVEMFDLLQKEVRRLNARIDAQQTMIKKLYRTVEILSESLVYRRPDKEGP